MINDFIYNFYNTKIIIENVKTIYSEKVLAVTKSFVIQTNMRCMKDYNICNLCKSVKCTFVKNLD